MDVRMSGSRGIRRRRNDQRRFRDYQADIRTFRFGITENAYVLVTFRVSTLEHCESHTEFYMPHHSKLDPIGERLPFNDVEPAWARRIFEQSLDGFVDAYVESLGENKRSAASGICDMWAESQLQTPA